MFLARTDEQKRFRLGAEELLAGSIANEQSPVILVHGSGGMGKSELCERFAEIGDGAVTGAEANKEHFVVIKVDWQEERDNHSSEYPALTGPRLPVILAALHDRVASDPEFEEKQGKKRVDRAFSPYLRVVTKLAAIEEEGDPDSGADFFDPAMSAGATAAGAALGVPMAGEALAGVASGVRAMRRRGRDDAEKVALVQRPHELLMREFARGLRDLSDDKPIVLILDTYELITSCGGWIRQVMGQTGGRVLWVLAGRLENEEDAGRSGEIASFRRELPERSLAVMRISPFDRDTASELLEGRGISSLDEQTIDAVVSLTRGVPLAVDIVASLLREESMDDIERAVTPEGDASKVVRELTERYLRHAEKDPDLQPDIPLLYGLALLYADRADLDLIGALWGVEGEVGTKLAELASRHDFVLTGRRRLHQEVRETFQRFLLNEVERREYEPSNRRAAVLALARADALAAGRPVREMLDDKGWTDALAAVIWHRFWVDNADGLDLLCEVFPEAVLFARSFAHELVGLASFFNETFSPEQASLLRGLASLLSFGSFMDGWFAKRREAFQRDGTPVAGAESTDADRQAAFRVLRRQAGGDSTPRKASEVAAVELVIAKASLQSDPDLALTSLERAVDLIPADDTDLQLEVEEIGRGLTGRLARAQSGEDPSTAVVRAAELAFRYKEKSAEEWLAVAEAHKIAGKQDEAAVRFGEIADRFGDVDDDDTRRIVSRAIFEQAVAFEKQGREADAARVFGALAERYAESTDLELQQRVATAILNRSHLLARGDDNDGAIAGFRSVVARFSSSTSPPLRQAVVRAFVGLAATLRDVGKIEEAVSALDDLIGRFEDDSEMKSEVLDALGHKATLLIGAEENAAALETFDRLLAKAAGDEDEKIQRDVLTATLSKAEVLVKMDRAEQALEVYDEAEERAAKLSGTEAETQIAGGLIDKGQTLGNLGRYDEEIATYEAVAARFDPDPAPPQRRVVVRALGVRAARLAEQGSKDDALAGFRALAERFPGDEDGEVRANLAIAALNQASILDSFGRHEEELLAYERALDLSRTDPGQRRALATAQRLKAVTLGQVGRDEDALYAWDELLRQLRSPDSEGLLDEDDVDAAIARALNDKYLLLERMGRTEEAILMLEELTGLPLEPPREKLDRIVGEACFRLAVEQGLREEFSEALGNYDRILAWERDDLPPDLVAFSSAAKGSMLAALGREAEAIPVLDEFIARHGAETSLEYQQQICIALVNRAEALKSPDSDTEAIDAYLATAERFRDADDVEIRALSCQSLIDAAGLLITPERVTPERVGEAAEVFQRVIDRYGDDPGLAQFVARAIGSSGRIHAGQAEFEAALESYGDLIDRFRASDDPQLRAHVATAMADKASLLYRADRIEEALAVYTDRASLFEDDPEPALREEAAEALFTRASLLFRQGRSDEGIADSRRVVELSAGSAEDAARLRAVKASLNVGIGLRESEDHEAAILAFDDLAERFGGDTNDEIRALVGRALLHKSSMVESEDAISILDKVEAAVDGSVPGRRILAEGRFLKAAALIKLEDFEGAIVVFRELIDRFGEDADPGTRNACAGGLSYLGSLQEKLERRSEQRGAYEELIDRYAGDDDPQLRLQVAKAQFGLAYLFYEDGDFDDAVLGYRQVFEHYVGDEDPQSRCVALSAYNNGLYVLRRLNRVEPRIELYTRLIDLFGDQEPLDDEIRTALVRALEWRAELEAASGDGAVLDRAEEDIKRAVELSGESASALGGYALFLLDRRQERDAARRCFERAFDTDPEAAATVGNFARLLFEEGELGPAMEMAEQAFAHVTDGEEPLRLELHFYIAALGPPERREDALAKARELLDEGVRSPNWDLSAILARAAAEGAPRLVELEAMAKEIAEPLPPAADVAVGRPASGD